MTDYAAVVQKGIDEILRLRTINAGLLEALKLLANYENLFNDRLLDEGDANDMQEIAKKAIRKAEESE